MPAGASCSAVPNTRVAEALPAVEPLMACVMCDIILTRAKSNGSPPCALFSRLQCTNASSSAGLGLGSAFPVLSGLICDCQTLLSGGGVGSTTQSNSPRAWLLCRAPAARVVISLAKVVLDPASEGSKGDIR